MARRTAGSGAAPTSETIPRARIRLRRAYDAPRRGDGYRVLVDRLWPRGVARATAELDEWCRDVAPSDELRRWFAHDPDRWPDFQARYREELTGNPQVAHLAELASRQRLTLVYAASDTDRNNAVVLRDVLLGTAAER